MCTGNRNYVKSNQNLIYFHFFQLFTKSLLRSEFGNPPPKQLGARIADNPANFRPITNNNKGWCHRCWRQMRQIIRHWFVEIMPAKRIDKRFFGAIIALANIIFESFAPWTIA